MTSLVPQTSTSTGTDLEVLIKNLLERKPASAPEKAAKAPKTVVVTQKSKDAISSLNGLLESTKLPAERRRLTETEAVEIITLARAAKDAATAVKDAVEAAKDAVFTDFDLGLEADNDEDALEEFYDPITGHYNVAGVRVVEGTDLKFVRQLAEHAPTILAADLKQLWDDGKISRATYYKLTKAVPVPRELDEEALLDFLKKPGSFDKIAPAIQPGKIVASFHVKPVKDKN